LARFESGIWREAEKKYDAGKLECHRLLKALKKLRVYLYGVIFLVEIDANTLVHQLNQLASDLPGSVVNRWLAWIRMFSFEIKHIAGKRLGSLDGLSRRRRSVEDSDEEEGVEELEEEMDADLTVNEVDLEEKGDNEDEIEEDNDQAMPDEIKKVTRYLTTLQRPASMTGKQFDSFRQYALRFLVEEEQLFRRAKPGMPPRRVIWDQNEQKDIISQLHNESGHRGKKGFYEKVALRYWWKGLYRDVKKWVKTYEEYQKRSPIRVTEELHPILENPLWQRVGLDVVYMP